MAKWVPAKRDVLSALAEEILHNYGHGRAIAAVDGLDDAVTAAFADDLAGALHLKGHTVFRASLRDFHRPRKERSSSDIGKPEEFYNDSFDFSVLQRVLVDPFRMGGSTGFVTAAFDYDRDIKINQKWVTGPADAVLIIDGVFLNRPELRGLWNYSLWLTIAPDTTPGADFYLAQNEPSSLASAIINNEDADHPRRVYADSC
jgi:uridine kinase